MELLTPEEIDKQFSKLPLEWALVAGVTLELTCEFTDFDKALSYVNKVGAAAKKLNHHPDIKLTYDKVVLHITTHRVNGITQKDFELAQAVDQIKK